MGLENLPCLQEVVEMGVLQEWGTGWAVTRVGPRIDSLGERKQLKCILPILTIVCIGNNLCLYKVPTKLWKQRRRGLPFLLDEMFFHTHTDSPASF